MSKRRVTLFVPGPWGDGHACARAVGTAPFHCDWIPNDGSFGVAFEHAALPRTDVAAIEEAPGAALLELEMDLDEELAALVTIGKTLERAGGLGIRVEQSKEASGLHSWIGRLESNDLFAIYRTLVSHIHDAEAQVLYTCGMHLFSRPDAEIALSTDANEAGRWLTIFNCYQLGEDPVLLSGQTFRPDEATPRRRLERWPDARFPAEHPCHNPFGLWRADPSDRTHRSVSELALVFMPALAALLRSMEVKAGKPLTQNQVETITSEGACIAMSHENARALERSRGYADIDPELAWEQWKIVRRGLGT